jgi:hypothetical protein
MQLEAGGIHRVIAFPMTSGDPSGQERSSRVGHARDRNARKALARPVRAGRALRHVSDHADNAAGAIAFASRGLGAPSHRFGDDTMARLLAPALSQSHASGHGSTLSWLELSDSSHAPPLFPPADHCSFASGAAAHRIGASLMPLGGSSSGASTSWRRTVCARLTTLPVQPC